MLSAENRKGTDNLFDSKKMRQFGPHANLSNTGAMHSQAFSKLQQNAGGAFQSQSFRSMNMDSSSSDGNARQNPGKKTKHSRRSRSNSGSGNESSDEQLVGMKVSADEKP